MKSARRQKALAAKRQAKVRRFGDGKDRGKSKYAQKRAYLNKTGLWGFEVPMEGKFWR
jgi:hypothetical protein